MDMLHTIFVMLNNMLKLEISFSIEKRVYANDY